MNLISMFLYIAHLKLDIAIGLFAFESITQIIHQSAAWRRETTGARKYVCIRRLNCTLPLWSCSFPRWLGDPETCTNLLFKFVGSLKSFLLNNFWSRTFHILWIPYCNAIFCTSSADYSLSGVSFGSSFLQLSWHWLHLQGNALFWQSIITPCLCCFCNPRGAVGTPW